MGLSRDQLIDNCIDTIQTRAAKKGVKTEEERTQAIREGIELYQDMMSMDDPFTTEEIDQITRAVEYNLSVTMDSGSALLSKDYVPWYFERKNQIPSRFWDRYRKMLAKKLPFKVMGELDVSTSKIVDYAGDPKIDGKFQRRGLVVGDVQSGKTNCYLGVICKAIDAGYDRVIILTGTTNSLRIQTQMRVDEGVTGYNSDPQKHKEPIGVGLINGRLAISATTSVVSDFSVKYVPTSSGNSSPSILVIKKNTKVLENVINWLDVPQNKDSSGLINESLLLIDDEADNASVNTSAEEITATNKKIRYLLTLFTRASYVGYTATPYANIFIEPDTCDAMFQMDLFPKDFIYSMWAPSNYIGPRSIFEPDGKHSYMLRTIPNTEKLFEGDLYHKKTAVFEVIPESLKKAVAAFFISCTMRDLKGDREKPMSMMIHISRFNDVQDTILDKIQEAIDAIRDDIVSYYALPESEALKHETMRYLYDVWDEEYSGIEDWPHNSWTEIQRNLNESVHPIKYMLINAKSEEKYIDYRRYPDYRVIVIGGNALSRGLTLEGLMISYFYRVSKQYDTLLQMGRWFGYKDGFAEVCRVWTNPGIQAWFGYIGRVNDELKSDIDDMCAQKLTPSEYGIHVQEDMVGLLMTSRAKMRSSAKEFVVKCLAGDVHDTMYVIVDRDITLHNYGVLDSFYDRLETYSHYIQRPDHGNICWTDIPKDEIIALLRDTKVAPKNVWYSFSDISKLIMDGEDKWDVAIISRRNDTPGGSKKTLYNVHDMEIYCPRRRTYTFKPDADPKVVQMGNRTLKSPEDSKEFLSESEIARVKASKPKNVSAKDYMIAGRNPLLLIYYLDLTDLEKVSEPDRKDYEQMIADLDGINPVGFAIGFPAGAAGAEKKLVKYRSNAIYQRLNEDEDY